MFKKNRSEKKKKFIWIKKIVHSKNKKSVLELQEKLKFVRAEQKAHTKNHLFLLDLNVKLVLKRI